MEDKNIGTDVNQAEIDPVIKELSETMAGMGVDVSIEQVQQGLSEIYPEGINGIEQGVIIRELYRHFKQKK